MPSATQRVAAKLAAKQAAAATPANDEPEEADEAEEAEGQDEELIKPTGSMKERAAAARAARSGSAPKVSPLRVTDGEANDEDEDEDVDVERGRQEDEEEPEPTPKKAKASKPAAKGKKPASEAQLKARAAFAERSKAAAAVRKGEAEAPKGKTPIQTPDQVRAKQNADRKAARVQAEETEAARPQRKPTGKPQRLVPTKQVVSGKPKAKAALPTKATAKADKASKAKAPRGDSPKAKIMALWEKGKSRNEIVEALDVSYASVYFHTKGTPGEGSGKRGKIFVKVKLDAEGNPLPKGKTEEVNRSEAFRREFLSGEEIGPIAKKYDVRYQIVYTACRGLMDDAEPEEE